MTVKEALEQLRYEIEEEGHCSFIEDEMKVAFKCMEKQMPKKITHEATLYICCTCPSCKNVVDKFETFGESKVRVQYKYCHFCGQALDWSETDDR